MTGNHDTGAPAGALAGATDIVAHTPAGAPLTRASIPAGTRLLLNLPDGLELCAAYYCECGALTALNSHHVSGSPAAITALGATWLRGTERLPEAWHLGCEVCGVYPCEDCGDEPGDPSLEGRCEACSASALEGALEGALEPSDASPLDWAEGHEGAAERHQARRKADQ